MFMNWKSMLKFLLGIKAKEDLSLKAFIRCWHRRLGPYFYKTKYSPLDVVYAMKRAGMREGSTVFIQSSWGEFYNCTGTPQDLIREILTIIGKDGTLAMACMPVNCDIFDVLNTPTKAGYLAECFRKYPGVKRSINVRHSVCAIGRNADYLLSEHHLGETPWDEKSPYYKLSKVDALVFGLGLGPYWVGTITHCVDSLLKDKVPYYTDMWDKEKTKYEYIDYNGVQKSYYNYSMPKSGKHRRLTSYFLNRRICKKYLHSHYQQISNLQISCWEAKEVVPTLVELGRKGIDSNMMPLKCGYTFEK